MEQYSLITGCVFVLVAYLHALYNARRYKALHRDAVKRLITYHNSTHPDRQLPTHDEALDHYSDTLQRELDGKP